MRHRLILAGFSSGILLLAGCGGKQNPLKLDVASPHRFFDGMWDGFTLLAVFVMDVAKAADYQLYVRNAPDIYYVGYVIGVLVFLAAVGSLISRLP